jgi:hypothetical protein
VNAKISRQTFRYLQIAKEEKEIISKLMGDELTFGKKLENTNEDDLLTIRLGS